MAVDLNNFAYSFSHAQIRIGGKQFVGIRNVSVNQDLVESAVYGTDAQPIGRSVGRVEMGRGSITFSDFEEGSDFWESLGNQPLLAIWDLDYALVKDDGQVRSIACTSCRITSVGVEHDNGPDALEVAFPFSFLRLKINNIDGILDAKKLVNAAIDIAQNFI